jgi:hypothetical protein
LRSKGEAVFVHSPETRIGTGEIACWYGKTVSGATIYAYVQDNPLSWTDKRGLATDGVPLNSMNCEALKNLIAFEKEWGKAMTIEHYNPLNFSEDAIALDAAFPSIDGTTVSIDWMMRSGFFGGGSLPGISHLTYGVQKGLWNMLNLSWPWKNMGGEANSNAPIAYTVWLWDSRNLSLETMFAPALKQCECQAKK